MILLYIKIILTTLALPLPAPQLTQYLDIFPTFVFTGAKKAAMSLPRFMMTTRRRKTCKKSQLRGATGGARDIFTGALAPIGPRVEPPLHTVVFNFTLTFSLGAVIYTWSK